MVIQISSLLHIWEIIFGNKFSIPSYFWDSIKYTLDLLFLFHRWMRLWGFFVCFLFCIFLFSDPYFEQFLLLRLHSFLVPHLLLISSIDFFHFRYYIFQLQISIQSLYVHLHSSPIFIMFMLSFKSLSVLIMPVLKLLSVNSIIAIIPWPASIDQFFLRLWVIFQCFCMCNYFRFWTLWILHC